MIALLRCSGVKKDRPAPKMGGNFNQLGSNFHRESNQSEETSDILIQRELQRQVKGIACTIMGCNFYVLAGNLSRFWHLWRCE